MPNPNGKKKFLMWAYPDTIELIKNNYKKGHCRTQSEFIEKAVDFYSGHINADRDSYYLPKALLSNLKAIIDVAVSQINRMQFKSCVEIAMIENVLAATQDIDEASMDRLRGDCVEMVKRTNGSFKFENALKWQKK